LKGMWGHGGFMRGWGLRGFILIGFGRNFD